MDLSTSAPDRCAEWVSAQSVDPIGSAGRYDAFMLIEHPLPWPADLEELVEIGADLPDPARLPARTRMLLVVPRPDAADRLVTWWKREEAHHFVGTEVRVPPGAVLEAAHALANGDDVVGTEPAPPELLICTHGRRDRCCGSAGTRLVNSLADARLPVRVRRCSHTGGHRFAPTGLSLPEGRFWAGLDAAVAAAIATRTGDPVALHRHQRGSSSLVPWAQVLERACLERFGWEWLHWTIEGVGVDERAAERGAMVEIVASSPSGRTVRAEAWIEVGRDLAVPACSAGPGAVKTAVEYRLDGVRWAPPG